MSAPTHALISLEERFAEGILNGSKQVELRRRSMGLAVGTTIWMYVKLPIGEVIGSAKVQSLHTLAPATLWRKYGNVSGLSRDEFFDYFTGINRGFALVLEEPIKLTRPVSLDKLRRLNDKFHPPQFFQHLPDDGVLISAFTGKDIPQTEKKLRVQGNPQLECLVAAA